MTPIPVVAVPAACALEQQKSRNPWHSYNHRQNSSLLPLKAGGVLRNCCHMSCSMTQCLTSSSYSVLASFSEWLWCRVSQSMPCRGKTRAGQLWQYSCLWRHLNVLLATNEQWYSGRILSFGSHLAPLIREKSVPKPSKAAPPHLWDSGDSLALAGSHHWGQFGCLTPHPCHVLTHSAITL